ncbi:MAG: DNA polymerase III subunit gamma/tau [Bacteroidales bacterium]|nr:DNA polymerase III subunit gamma/tau [Bacteroidales bacterium]
MAEQYIVSARKYRPSSFETLIGQDNIARTLKNSIVRGQLAHAYLFCGPRGVGKTSMARIFAKTINCSNPSPEMEPCGECESCLSFSEGRSYCIHELDAASNNGVDDIKALLEKVVIPPQTGKYSVYIIDEVHMLSQAAFNAFLKTLEEPPAHAIFILCTTEKHKIIPTILSRCQVYDFNRIGISDIVANLSAIAAREGIEIDDGSLHIIARNADGAMRDALTIFDQTVAFCGQKVKYEDVVRNLNVLDYDYSFRLVDAFLAGKYADALLLLDEILAKGFNSLHFIGALSSHFRDLLVSRTGGLESLLELPASLKQRYSEQASRCSVKFIYDALGVLSACEAGYKASANQRLHIEYALMKLSFLNAAPAADVAAQATPAARPADTPQTATAQAPATPSAAESPAPAAESQAAPVEVPAAAPAKAAGSSALSLSAMKQKAAETSPVKAETLSDTLPSEEQIKEKWLALAENFASSARLYAALKNANLDIREEDGKRKVIFFVNNEAQKTWMKEQKLAPLQNGLRRLLNSHRVLLEVEVVAREETQPVAYMPAEKAEKLMKENPEVRNLVTDLQLDI